MNNDYNTYRRMTRYTSYTFIATLWSAHEKDVSAPVQKKSLEVLLPVIAHITPAINIHFIDSFSFFSLEVNTDDLLSVLLL